MLDYRAEAEEAARESVIRCEEKILTELFTRGYMFYDEFEVTDNTARYIPKVLKEKYQAIRKCDFQACEEMIKGVGICGLIYNSSIINFLTAQTIIQKCYETKI